MMREMLIHTPHIFYPDEDEPRLRVIENDEKWNMIKDILESLNKGVIPD